MALYYVRAERDHPSTVVSVNFEHKAPCSSASTVDFEQLFISGLDLLIFQSFLE